MSKFIEESKKQVTRSKTVSTVYIVLRVLVVVTLIAEIFNKNWNNVFLCALSLVLFLIPSILDKRLNVALPNALEIIILLFIFSAEILGEINEYYLHFQNWDTMLHTMNGFLMAAIGFSLIDILNRSDKIAFTLSPFYVAFFAFCFSMTTAVIWEFFEFGMDVFTFTDMQKDTMLSVISTVDLNPDGANDAIKVAIDSMSINNGMYTFDKYLDIGLFDTMKDMMVNCIGAIVFSFIGFFYIKSRGAGKFAKSFIPNIKKH